MKREWKRGGREIRGGGGGTVRERDTEEGTGNGKGEDRRWGGGEGGRLQFRIISSEINLCELGLQPVNYLAIIFQFGTKPFLLFTLPPPPAGYIH